MIRDGFGTHTHRPKRDRETDAKIVFQLQARYWFDTEGETQPRTEGWVANCYVCADCRVLYQEEEKCATTWQEAIKYPDGAPNNP